MLTAQQYEAIGRLTISFNEIDEVVKTYLPLIAIYSQYAPPLPNNAQRTFRMRADAFREVLNFAADAGTYTGTVLEFLDMADKVAARRNEYIHAVAFIDWQTNTRMLRMRSGIVAPNEEHICNLACEAAFVAWQLAESCEELLKHYLNLDQSELESTLFDDEIDSNGSDHPWYE